MNAGHHLNIRHLAVHHARLVVEPVIAPVAGEVEQALVVGVLVEERIVLAAECAPQHIATNIFAPFQLFEQRYAVEYLAVQVPRIHERHVAVVQELHVVDEVEGIILHNVRQVGSWHDEQRERHFVPLHTTLERKVHFAPRGQPQTFVHPGLGQVVGIVGTAKVVEAGGVAEREDGRIVIRCYAALLGVNPFYARLIA